MKSLELAAMFDALSGAIEEIDAIFEEYGFNIVDFDPDNIHFMDANELEMSKVYTHVHNLKQSIEQ